MKNAIILTITFFCLYSYSCVDSSNVKIEGTVEGGGNKKLVLERMSPTSNDRIDSVLIKENSQFYFETKVEEPTFYLLKVSEKNFLTLLIEPGEKVIVESSYKNLSDYKVKGSKGSRLVNELTQGLGKALISIDSLNKEFKGNHPIEKLGEIRSNLFARYDTIVENHRNFIKSFVIKNKSSLASIMALYQQYDEKRYVLDKEKDIEYFLMVDSVLMKKHPSSIYVRSNHQSIREVQKQLQLKEKVEENFVLGASVPDIALPNPKGDTIRLLEIKDKYVLIDFWASWSQTSREMNKKLRKVYTKYKDRGFEVYQVSLDRSRNAWVRAIEKDSLEWINVSDLQFWSSIAAKDYKIEAIPANVLINPGGLVVGRGLFEEKLENSIDWFIKNVPPKKK